MKQTRTWLITGCSTGIGRGIAEAVLQKGENAVVTARDKSRVKDFEERYPSKALAVTLDMEWPETIAQAVEQARERFGSIDVLINNAGHGYRAALEEGEPAAVAELFQTNFFGPVELIKLVLPAMREQKYGVIVNVSSIGAVVPGLGSGYYQPDSLDEVSAGAAACGMIYSFYGRLSFGTTDVELLRSGDLPPTFYCYGTRDPFYDQFLANADAAEEAGVSVERLQLDGMPHGFGAGGGWIPAYDQWLSEIFANN